MTSKKLLRPRDRASALGSTDAEDGSVGPRVRARQHGPVLRLVGSPEERHPFRRDRRSGSVVIVTPEIWGLLPQRMVVSRIQIRDLDQTVIGNPAHDIIRLALSLATASRGSDLPGVTTAHILEQVIEGYQAALRRDVEQIEDPPESVVGP